MRDLFDQDPIELEFDDDVSERKKKKIHDAAVEALTKYFSGHNPNVPKRKPVVDVDWLDMPRWEDAQEN